MHHYHCVDIWLYEQKVRAAFHSIMLSEPTSYYSGKCSMPLPVNGKCPIAFNWFIFAYSVMRKRCLSQKRQMHSYK